MNLQHQLRAELALRAGLLPEELAAWHRQTQTDGNRWVIHRSQIAAIDQLLNDLQQRQAKMLDGITPSLGADEFGRRRAVFESELTGTHGLAAVFRYVLNQREDADQIGRVLDLADRVAADCYLPVMDLAQKWRMIDEGAYRVPPLTYLHTAASALALTRNTTFAMVGLEIEGHSEQMLPVPLIAMPYHQSATVWTFCGIYHEVGHLLDQDFALTKALQPFLERKLAGGETPVDVWRDWLPELIADAFGILFGGSAFASYMARLLFLGQAQLTTITAGDRHPPGYLRMRYIAALLRATRVRALEMEADTIETAWTELYTSTNELDPYTRQCGTVAEVVLGTRLPGNMQRKQLRELAPGLQQTEQQARALAAYLATDGDSPAGPAFPIRAIPAGAQHAAANLPEPDDTRLRAIHTATVAFIDDLPTPQPMRGTPETVLSPARRRHLGRLTEALTFSPPEQ